MEKILFEFLHKSEAEELLSELRRSDIRAVKKKSPGVGSFSFDLYMVIIESGDIKLASKVSDNFRIKLELRRQKSKDSCPKCGSRNFEPRKLNLIQKLYFLGTRPFQCMRCNYKWVI